MIGTATRAVITGLVVGSMLALTACAGTTARPPSASTQLPGSSTPTTTPSAATGEPARVLSDRITLRSTFERSWSSPYARVALADAPTSTGARSLEGVFSNPTPAPVHFALRVGAADHGVTLPPYTYGTFSPSQAPQVGAQETVLVTVPGSGPSVFVNDGQPHEYWSGGADTSPYPDGMVTPVLDNVRITPERDGLAVSFDVRRLTRVDLLSGAPDPSAPGGAGVVLRLYDGEQGNHELFASSPQAGIIREVELSAPGSTRTHEKVEQHVSVPEAARTLSLVGVSPAGCLVCVPGGDATLYQARVTRLPGALSGSVAPSPVSAAGRLDVEARGFAPGEKLEVRLSPDPMPSATGSASATGEAAFTITVPSNQTPGRHALEVRGASSGSVVLDVVVR